MYLILHPTTFLYSFISINSFLMDSLVFSRCKICHLWTKMLHFFLIRMSFITFSYLVYLARNSGKMLHKSGERKYSCLIPDLRGKTFSCSPLRMMLHVDFLKMPFISWKNSLLTLVFINVLSWKSAEFYQMLFYHLLRWSCGFYALFY